MAVNPREMSRRGREYCEANGLDPSRISITFNAAGAVTGHIDLVGVPVSLGGWCCCGIEGCDGGLAERGVDPAELTSYMATVPLGGGS